MHPALLMLLRLHGRATIRCWLGSIQTPKGAVFFMFGVIAFILWLLPTVLPALTMEQTNTETVRLVAPLIILAICVITIAFAGGENAVYFSPGEVDVLFPGPFSRRELLAYKLAKGFMAAFPTAIICSVLSLRNTAGWIACFVGFVLALVFVQVFSLAFTLVGQSLAERAYTRTRKLVLLSVLVLLVSGLVHALLTGDVSNLPDVALRLRQSWASYCVLAVFDVFGQTITAERVFPDLLQWGALALVVNLTLIVLIMQLDAYYMESAVASSQRVYDALQRRRRSGKVVSLSNPGTVHWHLPQIPWLCGAGPVVWRQLTEAMRNSRGILRLLLIMSFTVGPILVMAAAQGRRIGTVTGGIVWLVIFVPMMFRFDFRSDVEHMDCLKMLPIRPTAIALGEIAPPALLTTLVHLVLLAALLPFVEGSRLAVAAAMVFALPFNALLFCSENLIFLMFPARQSTASLVSFQFFGRQMAFFLAKFLLLAPCCAAASMLGGLAFSIAGDSWLAFATVSWVVLMFEVASMIPCVAWAFRRFDLSMDMPP